ncbi:MAG: ABC-F family ATP-binding cassette domain-containing protein [Bosea sp.]|uniref:ABC-F family ATP-binding cassette domain-containing protein n=1 Tax=Bosea sp. (in: a-proteobacteria) TaxID=1871050 RepID=UPI002394E1BF|nr:ABC-F family ATP-binding cassette domain-containing protein [Bosea sp. (in: a-proteobacteria)]MCP4735543.1 ABC-F family ATP-binding cassette domain-containing protein [Bosea sp. (in: a-proteobacteria)]
MPASITLSKLSWSTPDGRSLFSDIDLAFGSERTGLVGRNGVGKTTLFKLIAGEVPPASGSVTTSGKLAVLTQSSTQVCAETVADLFGAAPALSLLERAERGKATATEIAEADWTLEARLATALARFRLDVPAATPLASLSGGQRTRIGLAALLFAEPDFLLLDEPTNNLDRDGRDAVIDMLASWRAGAIVISHDRDLLETMDAIVELSTLGATRYGGNWSHYREQKGLDLAAARQDLATAEQRLADVTRSGQVAAERQARRDGAGKRKRAKGDMPRILMGMMKNRSENSGGKTALLAERQQAQAQAAIAAARSRIEILQPLSVAVPASGLAVGRTVLRAEGLHGGHAPGRPIIRDLSFAMTGPERVAVTGPNGSGKSTLLRLLTGELPPSAGEVRLDVDWALLDQSVGILEASASIRDNFRRLNPGSNENACRAALARFKFRADAALQEVATLSGGELMRAGLACVLGGSNSPSLLILDEPTNHLDIDSIEIIEAGLRAYDGALLVVSHDRRFLEEIAISRLIELAPED